MNITKKIIITDTNVITDLDKAGILDEFVKLDNVYISDMIKNDEINSSTGRIEVINDFKTINASAEQITEIYKIKENTKGLSEYDIINFIIARDNNAYLATGDKKLKNYSEKNNVEVLRTLKLIVLMKENNIIPKGKAIKACEKLKQNNSTRIPEDDINNLIKELEKDSNN